MRKCTVCLQVILIHYIDAQLIRQLKKKRIRRIVGCADRINIENLAQQNIPLYLIRRHGVAVRRAGIVMIYAVELDLASVDKENIVVTSIKSAEDGNGFIMRAVETSGTPTTAAVNFTAMEKAFTMTWKPQEIKTVRIGNDGSIAECLIIE